MAEEQDKDSKTEQPTEKKIRDAMAKGNVPFSRELPIFGSALATITSAMRKAAAMGNPPRWRSQAEHERILASGYEKQFELTLAEANTAMALCGLGSFALHWPQQPRP